MDQRHNDADVERAVAGSAVFRAVRAALLAVDASLASSRAARLRLGRPRMSLGVVLIAASLTHAALETVLPATLAPAGRYVFAVAAGGAGLLLIAASLRRRA